MEGHLASGGYQSPSANCGVSHLEGRSRSLKPDMALANPSPKWVRALLFPVSSNIRLSCWGSVVRLHPHVSPHCYALSPSG